MRAVAEVSYEAILQILLAAFLSSPLVIEASPIRGVAPSEESKYTGATFSCFDGKASIPGTAVNDNFCDCSDASDEPGTGACSGMGAEAGQPWFYCPNTGGAPRYVFASRVGDGACDCCDGSDEWQSGMCKDECAKEGQVLAERLVQMKKSMERGIEKRSKAIIDMRQKAESSKARLAELRNALPALQATAGDRKTELEMAERLFTKHQSEKPGSEASPGATAAGSAASDTQGPAVSEYAKWMEKGEGVDTVSNADLGLKSDGGILRRPTDHKMLQRVEVRSGDLVDFVTFFYTDGESLKTGDGAGNEQQIFFLDAGEAIAEVKGGQGGLLDSIQFVTDKGRESQVYGGTGGERYSVQVQPGTQIVGLERGSGGAGRINAVLECESVDQRSPEEIARDNTRNVERMARRAVMTGMAEIKDLEAKLEGDFTDTQAAYSLFEEKCGRGTFEKYTYNICLFGDAKQEHTTLGRWKGWDSKRTNVAIFDDGETCFSGRKRSIRVSVQCGDDIQVRQVREPSQCTYEASMTHPAACDPSLIKAEETARVIMPYEGHDEL